MENNKVINWQKLVKDYSTPNPLKSWWQVCSSLGPFFVLWWLAYKALGVSYWFTLGICFVAQIFMIRVFIIMHDCGHGNFFRSKVQRTIVGYITGILSCTPFFQWAKNHGYHHQTSGNLNKRGDGDIWTLTVSEYEELSQFRKFCYHFYRFPLINFIIGPIYLFQIRYRFTEKTDGFKEKLSVHITNVTMAVVILVLSYNIGFVNFLIIQGPILIMTQIVGCWLFYVQHQYKEVYWQKNESWNYYEAALKGSSYYKLPKFLQWWSGNIGFHHIHHLSHQIPNYNLEKCFKSNPVFQNSPSITFWESIKCAFLKLYDEKTQELITFKEYRRRYSQPTH